VDPVFTHIISCCVALLFAVAAVHKLRAPAVFRASMQAYRLLPEILLAPAAGVLITLELLAAVMALVAATRVAGLGILAGLLMLYAGAIGINLYRGRTDIDCGCNGPASKQTISGWLVLRNLLLAALALLAITAPANRALNWLDWLTIAFGVLVSAGLYLGFNQLTVQAPRLAWLRDNT
jgi:hypothetical protein